MKRVLVTSTLAVCFGCTGLLATPTGLNNIPTADVPPTGVLVFQTFANFGSSQPSRFTGGFKFGMGKNWEVGYDGRLAETGSGAGVSGAGGAPTFGATFQTKYRIETADPTLQVGVGAANLSLSANHAGDAVQYAVVTKDFRRWRGHLGYMFQTGKDNLFLGFDAPVDDRWTVRLDFNNLNGTDNLLSSIGFIGPLSDEWVLEGWWSNSRAAGLHDTITVKLNYVIPLR